MVLESSVLFLIQMTLATLERMQSCRPVYGRVLEEEWAGFHYFRISCCTETALDQLEAVWIQEQGCGGREGGTDLSYNLGVATIIILLKYG